MRQDAAYELGRQAAQVPAQATSDWLAKILAANSEWPEYLKNVAGEALDTAPYALLGMAKSFALERANKAVGEVVEEAKTKARRHLLGKGPNGSIG